MKDDDTIMSLLNDNQNPKRRDKRHVSSLKYDNKLYNNNNTQPANSNFNFVPSNFFLPNPKKFQIFRLHKRISENSQLIRSKNPRILVVSCLSSDCVPEMDDMEDNGSRYSRKPYPHNFSNPRKLRTRDHIPYARPIATGFAAAADYYEEEDEELEELDVEMARQDDEEEFVDFERHPKKRKLKNLVSTYEFLPRAKTSYGGRDLGTGEEWNERAVFVLLEVWGDKFVQLGRRSLRSEDWQEVAEKVSEVLKIPRTETQCRGLLDKLKKKFKKEKMKMQQLGLSSSKWAYFKKMDILMASPGRHQDHHGLACGVDSGEFVFADTRVYLERSNGFDEMRDSPVESENSEEENEDDNGNDSDELPPRRGRGGGGANRGPSSSFRVLADSIQKFGEIYGKIESNKRQQMMELENMRRDFYRELELQKKQILERTQAEIAKIQENDDDNGDDNDDGDDDEDTDYSAEDLSE